MNIEQLADFFMWMSIVNIGLLILTAVLFIVLGKTVRRLHGRLFGIDESQVALVAYGYLGTYRLLVLVFNIVPFLSLYLMR